MEAISIFFFLFVCLFFNPYPPDFSLYYRRYSENELNRVESSLLKKILENVTPTQLKRIILENPVSKRDRLRTRIKWSLFFFCFTNLFFELLLKCHLTFIQNLKEDTETFWEDFSKIEFNVTNNEFLFNEYGSWMECYMKKSEERENKLKNSSHKFQAILEKIEDGNHAFASPPPFFFFFVPLAHLLLRFETKQANHDSNQKRKARHAKSLMDCPIPNQKPETELYLLPLLRNRKA